MPTLVSLYLPELQMKKGRLIAFWFAMLAGIVLTAVLFFVGFSGEVTTQAPVFGKSSQKAAAPAPEEKVEEEIFKASSVKPVVTPKITMTPQIEVKVDMPEIKVDYAVNPMLEVGMAAPMMPQMASSADMSNVTFAMSELDRQPATLFAPFPSYPSKAKNQRKEGRVLVSLVLDPQGRVLKSELVPGPDNELFGDATLRAVRNWRFQPAEKNGQKVMCRVEVPVHFRLTQ